jgi:hypothetical protein
VTFARVLAAALSVAIDSIKPWCTLVTVLSRPSLITSTCSIPTAATMSAACVFFIALAFTFDAKATSLAFVAYFT